LLNLFASFLLGSKRGAVSTAFLLSLAVLFVAIKNNTPGFAVYTLDFTMRFFPSFLVVFAYSYIFESIREKRAKGKRSGIIVAAEGIGDCQKLAQEIEENTGAETRRSVLGYIQRGGNPSARSRLLASLFANKAIELLLNEQASRIVGLQDGAITSIDLETSCKKEKPLELDLVKLAGILSR